MAVVLIVGVAVVANSETETAVRVGPIGTVTGRSMMCRLLH